MKRNQILHKVLALVLTIAALMAGQQTMAESKTVTYTITSIESINLNYEIVFTRSGDDPFDTEAPSTYTVTVSPSVIGQTSGGAGGFSVELADGFSLQLHWGTDSDIRFSQNCIYPHASNKLITYDVSCDNANYYVTHVKMTGFESNLQSGMLDFSNNKPIDTDYDSAWNFQQTYRSRYSFGQITVTYSDTPALSIFESAGTDTYNIKDKDDLRHLANLVNNGKNECSGLTFLQTQDITCDDTYVPIGYYKSDSNRARFSGTYNGQGHTVSGITVSRTASTANGGGYIGLFGYVYQGTVENVILANSTFTGDNKIGGIVGFNYHGTVQNCRVESTVTIKAGCNGAVYHGGIVGDNSGSRAKVIGCFSAASIKNNGKSNHKDCGGIVGYNWGGTIQDCLYTGNTIEAADKKGGILGYEEGNPAYTNNYYTSVSIGGVGAEGSSSDQDGARRARLVNLGENVGPIGNEIAYDVSELLAIGTTVLCTGNTLYSGEGQTVTFNYFGEVPAGYLLTFSASAGTISGNTLTMPASNVTVTATVAPNPWEGEGTGTEDDPYQISNYAELKQFANIVNGTGGEAYTYASAKLVDDIVCKNSFDDTEFATDWVPIGNASHPYIGTFDGQGHTIMGLSTPTDNTSDYVGLFGYIGSYGVVKDVILEYATMTGNSNVGVVAGHNDGTLTGNYYISCSANDATADIGTGSGDCDGARGLFTITLSEGVTAATATITLDGTDYYTEGTIVTLSGTPPEGYAAPVVYSLNGTTIDSNTFTMPAEDVTVSAHWAVPYIDADGDEQICTNYTFLESSTGSTVTLGTDGTESWYVVNGNVNITCANDNALEFYGDIHLILKDGATLTANSDNLAAIYCSNSLTIYGQSGGTGSIVATNTTNINWGILTGDITINGGNISATGGEGIWIDDSITINGGTVNATGGGWGIYAQGNLIINGGNLSAIGEEEGISIDGSITINGGSVSGTGYYCCYCGIWAKGSITINSGTVTATGIDYGIYAKRGTVTINGGTVTATGNDYNGICAESGTITLGWTNLSDRITASSYQGGNGIVVKSGQAFTDGTDIYSGTLTTEQLDGIARQELRPCVRLTLPDGVIASGTGIISTQNGTYALPGTTVTLSSDIDDAVYVVNDTPITGNTFTMPASDVTITVTVAPNPWEGEGTGTEDDPYQISNYAELKQFANIVNGTGGEVYAKLVYDIVCKNNPYDPEYATDWVPIGNASHPYIGTFDGQGHTIMGLSTPTDNTSDYVGLFGYIGSYGVVKDVILEYATMTGNSNVGVVAGHNDGTLTDNYYTNCSANDATTNIGTGSGDCDGARSIYVLTANEHDGNYWTTFYSSKAGYKINDDENACAYTATYASATLTLHKLGKVIPAGTAVIIVGSAGSIGLTASSEAAEYTVENKLRGVDEWTLKSELGTGTGTVYVMGKVDGNFGFFEYTGTYMPAHKAYLLISSSSVNGFKMEFEEDDATSIQTLSNSPLKGENIYNLAGQRLNKMQKGINIVNGKKILK